KLACCATNISPKPDSARTRGRRRRAQSRPRTGGQGHFRACLRHGWFARHHRPALDSRVQGAVAIIVRFSYNERPAASDMSDEHESFIKTPKQLVWIIFLAFAVPIAIITLLITYVGTVTKEAPGSDNMTPEAIEARIKPVAGFELGSGGPASAEPRTGEAVYTAQCAACHAAGVAGAPKMGDAGAWAERLKQGL